MSVERVSRPDGTTAYKVRWRTGGRYSQSRSRTLQSARAADAFDRKVKDLKASGELDRLDEQPRGEITVEEYVRTVWWPEYAQVHLTAETRSNYLVQLEKRIVPKWGGHQLRHLRTGAIEAWVGQLRAQGVGDPTILRTLTVMRSLLKRAMKDEEIERNPVVDVEKPAQQRRRKPRPIAPVYVELIRQHILAEHTRRDVRGRRVPQRDPMTRLRDATLVSLLAYSGPRPESEAIPLTWAQVQKRTLVYWRTKHRGGQVTERTTRLLAPLARDLADYRMRQPPGTTNAERPVFPTAAGGGVWTGDDWDNWRERVFQPAAVAVGLPEDTIPRDLRGSFASLLIYEGMNVVEVAKQLGHKPATCLRDYASVFEEFDPAQRRPAEDIIRDARELVATTPAEVLVERLAAGGVHMVYPRAAEGQE